MMREDEEAVEYAQGQRRHDEDAHRWDGFSMITQKRYPSLLQVQVSSTLSASSAKRFVRAVEFSGAGQRPWRTLKSIACHFKLDSLKQ